jgi:hypothetical protein
VKSNFLDSWDKGMGKPRLASLDAAQCRHRTHADARGTGDMIMAGDGKFGAALRHSARIIVEASGSDENADAQTQTWDSGVSDLPAEPPLLQNRTSQFNTICTSLFLYPTPDSHVRRKAGNLKGRGSG